MNATVFAMNENEDMMRVGDHRVWVPFWHDTQIDGWHIHDGIVTHEGGASTHPWTETTVLDYAHRLNAWKRRERFRPWLPFLNRRPRPMPRGISITNCVSLSASSASGEPTPP